jgi:hypothetical protein
MIWVLERSPNVTHLVVEVSGDYLSRLLHIIRSKHPAYWEHLARFGSDGGNDSDSVLVPLAKVEHLRVDLDGNYVGADDCSRRCHPPLPMPLEWPLQLPNITTLEMDTEGLDDMGILNLVPCLAFDSGLPDVISVGYLLGG